MANRLNTVGVWSLDDGYGDLKGFNGAEDLLLPSYSTEWIKQMRGEGLGSGAKVDPLSHIGIEIEGTGGKFLVGEGALKQDTNPNWTGGSNKHLDDRFPILAKTCLALMAGDMEKVAIEPLVMGLPVTEDEKDERHTLLEEIMTGTHKMKLHLADGRELKKEIRIKEVITKKQPFGSFCDLILDDRGEITDKKLASSYTLIIDIGTRTLNVYTLDALDPITDLSDTFSQGVHTAYDFVGDFITQRLNFTVPRGKLSTIVKRGEIKGIDLGDVIKMSYKKLANEVFKIVDTLFIDSWVYVDNVIITGGGAEVLRPYLEKKKFPVNPIFLGRHATARGFRKYGVRHLAQKEKRSKIILPDGSSIRVGK